MRLIQRTGLSLLIASTVIMPVTNILQPVNVFAASTSSAVATSTIPSFSLGGGSYAKVTDLQFLSGDSDKTAYFTVSVYNNSNKELDFSDYWVEMWTKSGTKYTIKMNEQDAKNTKIVAKTTTDYHFTAKVNAKQNLSDFSFKLIKWDFSQPDYTRTIGQVAVPMAYNPVIPAGTGKVVKMNNLKISSIVARSRFNLIGGQLEGVVIYRVTNYSTDSIPLSNFNYYMKRSGGSLTKLGADISQDEQLAPGESKEILLYGTLPIKKVDPNLQLVVTGTDPTTKLEAPIASYVVKPLAEASTYVKAGNSGKMTVDNMPVNTKIRDAFYDQDSDSHTLSMYVNFNNSGKSTVALPSYSYYVMTSDGALYPTKQALTTNIDLSPGIEKEQYLQFTLPEKANMTGLKLVLRKTSETNKKGYVAALFQVPSQTAQGGTDRAIQYVTKQGLFEFSVLRGERLPWGEQDIINAVIAVRNPQFVTKSLPNIKASIQLNGYNVDDKDIQLIKTDQVVAIPGASYSLYIVSTKVPYTFEASDMNVILSEVGGADGTASTPIGTFKLPSSKLQLPVLKSTDSMDVRGIGRTASLKINKVNTYVDDVTDTKLLYAEFDYKSLESRFSNLANLQAYFKTKNGNYIQASFQNIKDKVTPNKNSLVMAYASFPSDYDLTDVQLIVGQGTTQNQFTGPDATADGFVDAVQYGMPAEKTDILQDTFENMVINPYKISLRKLSPSLQDAYKINIDFEYDLAKIGDYEKVAGTHKLVVELVDQDNKFEQEFDLENGNDALKIGDQLQGSVAFEDRKIWGIIYRQFTVNIYDEFQGHKKLIATKKLNQAMTNG
ncbi:hypothetical protein A8990_105192 [Paenibacillus taihuensis]|uniref:Uncharacterized protein n=1 Tax=Paenibacillus taihuensis TaxID=1156355 RepID=A0A3D9SP80_9BACL|nr:hypothetical protein [Paenibacillus taihuensis]REE91486.1 hypothetical protein A8990_105192 [Paenibacillus taihuensis]